MEGENNVPRIAASGDSCGEGEGQISGIFMGSWSLFYPIPADRVKAEGNKAGFHQGLVMSYSRKNLSGTEMCIFLDKINKNKKYKYDKEAVTFARQDGSKGEVSSQKACHEFASFCCWVWGVGTNVYIRGVSALWQLGGGKKKLLLVISFTVSMR